MRTLLVIFLVGCSGSNSSVPDGSTDMARLFDLAAAPDFALPNRDPADHPPLIRLTDHHGTHLSAMEIYTVVWQGEEALGAEMDHFHGAMLGSSYWTSRLGEYGMGAGTAKGVLVVPQPPPATIGYTDLESMIDQNIAGGVWPTPSANTAFAYIVPSATVVDLGGTPACSTAGGYHSETPRGVPYMVDLQCSPGFDLLTVVASHEAAECATDARPMTMPGWLADGVGEVGDLCVGSGYVLSVAGDGGTDTYQVTRLYSNAAAALGTVDPCGPAPVGEPWFGAAVSPPTVTITLGADGTGHANAAIEPFAVGSSAHIRWQVSIDYDFSGTGLSAVPVQMSGYPGQTFPVTFRANTMAASGTYPISIYATSGGLTKTWFSTLVVQ